MNAEIVRFGMIGAGAHASHAIYPSLRYSNLVLTAVADLDEDRARNVGSRFGSPRVYTDFEKMLAVENLDAVGVVGPPELHHEAGLAVLTSGRHLFVEKPPAPDLERARALQAAASQRGLQVMVGFMKRHATIYQRAWKISQRAEFGRRTTLRLNYSHVHLPPQRHFVDMSIHALDLARYFMGGIVGGVVTKRTVMGSLVAAVLAHHSEGGISQITLSAHEPRVQESVELAGESTLVQARNLTELRYHPPAPGWDDVFAADETMTALWYPEFTIPMEGTDSLVLQGYAGELRHFARALTSGAAVSPNIDDGVEAMRFAEALGDAPEGTTELRLPA